MTGSIRNFENKNFTPKSRIFVSLKVKLPDMTDWHTNRIRRTDFHENTAILTTGLTIEAIRIVTIVTVQSLPKISREAGRVLRHFHQPSRRTIRPLWVRIPESGRISGRRL